MIRDSLINEREELVVRAYISPFTYRCYRAIACSLPQQRNTDEAQANIPYNRSLETGAYTVTPQQVQRRHSRVVSSAASGQELYKGPQQPYTSADSGSTPLPGFQTLNIRSVVPQTPQGHQAQRQQSWSCRLLRNGL